MNILHSVHLSSLTRRLRSGTHQDPVRDWILALIFFGIVLIAIVVWNAWAFDTVSRGGTIGVARKNPTSAFDSASIGAVHAVFEKRAAEEVKYGTGTYRFADPSQ